MPPERPLPARHSIGGSFGSVMQAWGFSTLSLRETIWFYGVGLLTLALLAWSPLHAVAPKPAPVPGSNVVPYELSVFHTPPPGALCAPARGADSAQLFRHGVGSSSRPLRESPPDGFVPNKNSESQVAVASWVG
jgi:hypothetical protein